MVIIQRSSSKIGQIIIINSNNRISHRHHLYLGNCCQNWTQRRKSPHDHGFDHVYRHWFAWGLFDRSQEWVDTACTIGGPLFTEHFPEPRMCLGGTQKNKFGWAKKCFWLMIGRKMAMEVTKKWELLTEWEHSWPQLLQEPLTQEPLRSRPNSRSERFWKHPQPQHQSRETWGKVHWPNPKCKNKRSQGSIRKREWWTGRCCRIERTPGNCFCEEG